MKLTDRSCARIVNAANKLLDPLMCMKGTIAHRQNGLDF